MLRKKAAPRLRLVAFGRKGRRERVERIIAGKGVRFTGEVNKRASNGRWYKHNFILKGGTLGTRGTLDFTQYRGKAALSQLKPLLQSKVVSLANKQKLAGVRSLIYVRGREVLDKGRGIGTAMLEKIEDIARQRGIDLVVAVSNKPAAIRTYEKRKWVLIEERHGYYLYGNFLR